MSHGIAIAALFYVATLGLLAMVVVVLLLVNLLTRVANPISKQAP